MNKYWLDLYFIEHTSTQPKEGKKMIEATAQILGILGLSSLAIVFVSFFTTIYCAKKLANKNS
jgi:hypothetical protein